jgi:chaperonin GroEL
VLLVESPIDTIRQIQTVLEYVIKNNKPLLIIGDLEQGVLSALAMNKMKGNIRINVIDAPTYGVNRKQMLDDLSMLTNATIINEDLGDDMDLIQVEHLGKCVKSITTHSETIIQVKETSEQVRNIIKDIKSKLLEKNTTSDVIRLEKKISNVSR